MKRTCKNYGYALDFTLGGHWFQKFDDPKELIRQITILTEQEKNRMDYSDSVEDLLRDELKGVYRYEKKPAFSDEDIEEIITNSKRF